MDHTALLTDRPWAVDDAPASPPLPPPAYAADGDHLHHFQGLMHAPARLAVLTHLLSHCEGIVAPPARVKLYQALQRQWQGLHEGDRATASAFMDGRFAPVLACIAAPWGTPQAIRDMAWAHLQADSGLPTDPDFVTALYASLDITEADQAPAHWAVADVWPLLEARARGLSPHEPNGSQACEALQAACLSLAERDPAFLVDGMVLLWTLALRLGDGAAATELLAECLHSQLQRRLTAQQVCDWLALDGPAPLTLSPALAALVCHPAALVTADGLTRLHAHLAWPTARQRVAQLAQVMGLKVPTPDHLAAPPELLPAAQQAAWDVLHTYTTLCQAVPAHLTAPQRAQAQALLAGGGLLPPALVHLACVLAQHACAQGRWPEAMRLLCDARQCHGQGLAVRLMAQALHHKGVTDTDWLHASASTGPHAGAACKPQAEPAWVVERRHWEALLRHSDADVAHAARHMLATCDTQGSFEPTLRRKCQRLDLAQARWTELLAHPDWRDEAQRQLATMPFVAHHRLLRQDGGREHLWLERPQAQRVLIVFSCVDSHHTFASVPSLVAQADGHHLLFVNNPELNWYADGALDAIDALIVRHVLSRFRPDQVCCYFGSMGGYGAMRLALRHGLRAVVFNPQIDLDLWAVYRPDQRDLMQAPTRRLNLQDATLAEWSRVPLYIMVGAGTADRMALDLLIGRLRQARHANLIVEKFADPHHPGLIARASLRSPVHTLVAADARLGELSQLHAIDAPQWQTYVGASREAFWRCLSEARAMKVEIRIRDGLLCAADSQACDTR